MVPFKSFLTFKMPTRYSRNKFIFSALLLLVLVNVTFSDTRTRTPARILAKQTGATQFEEEHYETHADCNDNKHHLKKRSSDEDIDYEVYQGVVGRPGIDFPIYPRIPKTSFSCRSFGNGYFADMDTDCQVFHICEEGRKISFLCPNGTIFQQSELTCDWWFKVNCLGSPGYYAESAEILNKQRVQRVRPSVPVQGFNIVGGGLNIKAKVASNNLPRSRHSGNKSDRRMDSNEEPSLESVDFDDVSSEKQLKGQKNKNVANIDNNNNDNESQITAETASFVDPSRRNSYTYEKPSAAESRNGPRNGFNGSARRNNNGNGDRGNGDRDRANSDRDRSNGDRGNGDRGSHRNGYANLQPNNFNNESTERARNGYRGQQRYKEKSTPESFESIESKDNKKSLLPEKIVQHVVPAEASPKSNKVASSISAEPADVKPEFYESHPVIRSTTTDRVYNTTPQYPSGTHSTARRLDTARSTPFYTPTIPSLTKSKTTEGKGFYIKGVGSSIAATTPIPNRFNIGAGSSGIFLESSAAPKPTPNSADPDSIITSTFRPTIIGMRHYDSFAPEIHPILITSNSHLQVELPIQKSDSREYLPTTARPASTGPTYLPKSASAPRSSSGDAVEDASGGDLLFFASSTAEDEAVSRNVNEMIKTMNLLQDKLKDVEEIKFQGQARAGLEIPPSSGPDALVSLAKYFAGEQNGSSANSLNGLSDEKPSKSRPISLSSSSTIPTTVQRATVPSSIGSKPSDKTATITTAATPGVDVKADDIKASLLSEKTVSQYSNLFGLKEAKGRQQSTDPSEGLLSHITNDTDASKTKPNKNTPFPQIGATGTTIRDLAEQPESRKIAQVFSNALTTYLEDPEQFRTQLASIRPTEPPVGGKANFEPVTATDSSLFRDGTAASYLPTRPTPGIHITTTHANIAAEINNNFDYSTQSPDISTTEAFDTTTYRSAYDSKEKKLRLELSAELGPPNADSAEGGDEFLQREQTQSFVKSRNDLNLNKDDAKTKPHKSTNSAYISADHKLPSAAVLAAKPTENPWNHISQTDFLDPLTINDALMKESSTTTSSPFTYLPKDTTKTTTHLPKIAHGNLNLLSTDSQIYNVGSMRGGDSTRSGSAEETTKRSPGSLYQQTTESGTWQDIFSTYDLPRDTLPSSSGLQRIANKLFGGLNETEALHLKNVMQQAEHNRQILSLLLLLIQTCDDQNGKALERSRKHLLNALIDMDGKLQNAKGGKTSHQKSAPTTTTRTPVTTYRRNGDDISTTTSYPPTTSTDLSAAGATAMTTFSAASTLLPGGSSNEDTTKFEIHVEDPDEQFAASTIVSSTQPNSSSDKRALELLKSLYSLASKFTSRR